MSSAVTSTQELHIAEPERFPGGTLHLASDYGLHVSNSQDKSEESTETLPSRAYELQPAEFDPTLNEHPWPADTPPQPESWTHGWRDVPPLRPTNRELDQSLRVQGFPYNVGAAVMLTGCWAQATTSKLWQNTVQRIKPHYGDAPVGGKF